LLRRKAHSFYRKVISIPTMARACSWHHDLLAKTRYPIRLTFHPPISADARPDG
jgi:hypothetical protein